MSNTLKFGNGTWATKKGSTLAYNDENNNFKPLPFNFERASSGTTVNQSGLIETVGSGIPRIDFQGNTKGTLLLEPSRTNLFQRSEDFTQGWTEARIETPYIADVVSPNGTLNAYTLEMSSGETSGGGIYNVGTSISGDNSFSVFAKKGNADYLVLGDTGLDSSRNAVYFNLSNGTIGTEYQNAVGEMKYFGNGWYRCTMKYSLTSNANKFIYLTNKNGETTNSVVGGDFIYIYGAQLEQGSYPTSYIPTSGSSVTRQADTASGSGNSAVFNDSEGVLFADIQGLNEIYRLGVSENASTSNRILIGQSSNGLSYLVTSNTTAVVNDNVSGYGLNQKLKIAAKYKQNNFALWVNGFEVITVSSGNTPTNLNSLDLKGQGFNAYIKTKELGYYDTALTDLELEYLTSYRSLNELATELNLNTL